MTGSRGLYSPGPAVVVARGASAPRAGNGLFGIRRPVSAGLEPERDAELYFPTRTEALVAVFRPAAQHGGAYAQDVLLKGDSPCTNRRIVQTHTAPHTYLSK